MLVGVSSALCQTESKSGEQPMQLLIESQCVMFFMVQLSTREGKGSGGTERVPLGFAESAM